MSYPVENVIQINTRISPAGLSTANFAKALLFAKKSEAPAGFVVDTTRTYYSPQALAADFPTTSETYKAGVKWLGGTPATNSLTVWATNPVDTTITTTLTKAFNLNWWFWSLFTKDVLANETSVLAIAAWCETNNIAFPNSQTDGAAVEIRNPAVTDDIVSQLKTLGYRMTFTVPHATDPYAAYAFIKHFAAVNYSATNSTITGEFKKSPGVAAEDLSDTEYSAMIAKGAVFYSQLDLQGATDSGRWLNTVTHSSYGEYVDDVVNLAAFVNSLRVGLYNALANQTTKLPQTPVGQAVLNGAAARVGQQYVTNNYLGARNYVNPDTGLTDYTEGYEVLTLPEEILDLSDADRAARKAAPIRMRIFRSGAIHSVQIDVDVY